MWKSLFEDGVEGLVRGDEGLGWGMPRIPMAATVRIGVGCAPVFRLPQFETLPGRFGRPGIAAEPAQRGGRNPASLARPAVSPVPPAHDHLGTGRLEACLHGASLPLVVPQDTSCGKAATGRSAHQQDTVQENRRRHEPQVEFASSGAIASPQQILRDERIVDLLKEELSSEHLKQVVPAGLLGRIVEGMETGRVRTSRLPTRAG